jgi:hypothetical protein
LEFNNQQFNLPKNNENFLQQHNNFYNSGQGNNNTNNFNFNSETKIVINNMNDINVNNANTYVQQNTNNNNNSNNIFSIQINVNKNLGDCNNNNFNNNLANQNQNNVSNVNYMNNFNNNNIYNNNQIPNNNFSNQNQFIPPPYDSTKIKRYLNIIIAFIKSETEINDKIHRNHLGVWNCKDDLYLINKNWIINFFTIFKIQVIYNIISSNNSNILSNEDYNYITENIFLILDDNTKKYFNDLNDNYIIANLSDSSQTKIQENYINLGSKYSKFFSNFYFLRENFVKSLYNILNINIAFLKTESIMINNKISLFTNENNIYIGNLSNNFTFNIERIIFYQKTEIKNEFMQLIQVGDNTYQNYLLLSAKLIPNDLNIQILNIDQNSIKNSNIIEKLKFYINFYKFKEKLIDLTNNPKNTEDEIIIVRKDLFKKIFYEEIMNILNIYMKTVGDMNDKDELVNNILINLKSDDIELIKQLYVKINFDNIKKDDILSKRDFITSPDNDKISFYNDTFLVKKEFIRKDIPNKYIRKIISGNGINIIVIKNEDEKTLLIGSVINNDNSFKLTYIFTYKTGHDLDRALEKLKNNYLDYIDNRLIFDKEEYIVSPIFRGDGEIVGYGYKYNDNLLNLSLDKYYLCDNLKNVFKLYIYYNFLKKKIQNWNKSFLSANEYCLVNKKSIERYKESFNYNNIISIISSQEDKENEIKDISGDKFEIKDKQIYSFLKRLDLGTYLKYNNDFKNLKFNDEYGFMLDVKTMGYVDLQYNNQHKFDVPYDFEIFPKDLIRQINSEINNFGETKFTNCEINNNLILIDFPFDLNGSGKYISLVAELDYNNSLEVKSVMVFYQEFQKKTILREINYDLHELLKEKKKEVWAQKNEYDESIGYDVCYILQFNKNDNFIINGDFGNNNFNAPKDDNNFYQNNNYDNGNNNNNGDDLIYVDEAEYNLDYQVMYPYINTNYPYPHLIGLDNIGATCYMNATLQCFCNILPFVNYFKYDKNLIYRVKNDIGKKTLSSSFKLLIEKLWPNDLINKIKSYSPHEFKAKISYMNELFRGVAANDSKDLVNFIIMTLHEELNMIQNQILIS